MKEKIKPWEETWRAAPNQRRMHKNGLWNSWFLWIAAHGNKLAYRIARTRSFFLFSSCCEKRKHGTSSM